MTRYQYRIVNLGIFDAEDRMLQSFAELGADGWQLVATYDRGANWLQGLEKGVVLFMRTVAKGEEPVGPWASRYVHADHHGG